MPGGVLVGFEQGINAALEITSALMDDSSVPAIFEATFCHSNVLVRVDLLQRRPGNCGHLIEVKSSVEARRSIMNQVRRHPTPDQGIDHAGDH